MMTHERLKREAVGALTVAASALDRGERDYAAILGEGDRLLAALRMEGFDDWTDVVRLAREAHPVAIEALARRVERAEAAAKAGES